MPELIVLFLVGLIVVWLLRKLFSRGGKQGGDHGVIRGPRVEPVGKPASLQKNQGVGVQIGGVEIPPHLESQHILFAGATGSGKSQGISRILSVVRARRSRALIADAGGGFLSHLYAADDLVLNPFDQRTVHWSPFAEIREEYDCMRIARAAIPDGTGQAQEWNHYAQVLLSETLLAHHHRGDRSVVALIEMISSAGRQDLYELLKGTPAAAFCGPDNEKMLSSIRSVASSFLQSWRYLRDEGTFSIRNWIRAEGSNWVYLTYRDDQAALLRPLVATVLELAITEGLSLSEDPSRDLWLILDEVDSLGKVSTLRDGLSKLRKYGGKCVLGLQTISQLRSTYGEHEAQTLMANISTKVILRAGDGQTAEYLSTEIGDREVEVETVGKTRSLSQAPSATRNKDRRVERTVLGSEISGLPDLHGFLKVPERLIRIEIEYKKYPDNAEAYIRA